jgi:hypothetical protein
VLVEDDGHETVAQGGVGDEGGVGLHEAGVGADEGAFDVGEDVAEGGFLEGAARAVKEEVACSVVAVKAD